jgi:uncharacterized protein YbjT (DUF2867 family)
MIVSRSVLHGAAFPRDRADMIVITTPTGDIGRQVLAGVLAAGDEPVRVIARDPARLPADVRDRVEVVAGSHDDAAVADRAFAGADSVFWVIPPDFTAASLDAAYVDFTRPAAEAFARHGVARVVGVSALGRGSDWESRAGHVTASLAMDDLIATSGVAYRALVMPSFMDNVLRQVEPIREQGVFFGPLAGDTPHPTVATRDIAAAGARLLLDATWTGTEEVPVLGPENLSHDAMAQIVSDVLGRPVRYQQIPIEAYTEQFARRGASDAVIAGMRDMMLAKEAGLDEHRPRTPEGTTPTTFRTWCEEVLAPAVAA